MKVATKKSCCGIAKHRCCSDASVLPETALRVALVGNPNCGKTTLFNQLTGGCQRVGNWPGVTVEYISGFFTEHSVQVEVVDLPGIYTLGEAQENTSVDACLACHFVLHNSLDAVINVVDATQLERHLYLTMQLLARGIPVILALNCMDTARAEEIDIDIDKLSQRLGCKVVALTANRGLGVAELKRTVSALKVATPSVIPAQSVIPAKAGTQDVYSLATNYYQHITTLVAECLKRGVKYQPSWTERIDNIVLNRFLGIPLFFAVMYLLFVFTIVIGGKLQDYFASTSQAIFVDGLAKWLSLWHAPAWLVAILAEGLGKGISTTLTFIPVLGALFLFLAFLEDSGYMTRAAFVMDRCMRALGLPGKALVPMIIGFGCNVPAVMSVRILANKRDRILTIMMAPFMSCSARLAIYAVFAAAFFPQHGQNIVFALYLIGILMAIVTGFLLRHTLLPGNPAPLLLELPRYHRPRFFALCHHAWIRLQDFVVRAGKLIVPICMLIGTLNTLTVHGTITATGTDSLLAVVGKWLTPLFTPMGITADNWPATVGLITGVLAKEVVVGTLNTLYTQMGQLSNVQEVYGFMNQQFAGSIGAFAYLLFILLYFPCISTLSAMLRELHRGWSWFSALWMVGLAYSIAVIFYQAATWAMHPLSTLLWIISLTSLLAAFWYSLYKWV